MGPVVVVVVVLLLLLLFKTFTQYLKVVAAKEARVLERLNFKGSNPEESFKCEVRSYVDVRQVLATCQDFLRGWIPEYQGIQPLRKF